MAFAPHYRLTMIGTLGDVSGQPVEAFSMGVNLARGNTGNPSDLIGPLLDVNQDQVEDLAEDCRQFFADPRTSIGGQAILRAVKFAWIGPDGKYTQPSITVPMNQGGGALQTTLHPPQVALAVSLTTAFYGARGRGRFYLPLPALPVVNGSLDLGAGDRNAVAASAQEFLNNLGNEPGLDVLGLTPVVASSKGLNHVVNGVRVGRVFDTIRSRRRSMSESYGSVLPVSSTD